MRKIIYLVLSIGFFSLFSCADNGTQLVLEKYVNDENKKLPMYVDQYTTYDSIVCDANKKTVIMYHTVERDYVAENLKIRDNELVKHLTINLMKNNPQMLVFMTSLEELKYSLVLNYCKKNGEEVTKLVIEPDEFRSKGNPEQMEKIKKEQMENDCNSAKSMCPYKIDEHTILKDLSLDYDNKKLIYFYELHDLEITQKEIYKEMLRLKVKKVVDGPSLRLYKDIDMTFIYQYVLENDTTEIVFTPKDYSK